MSLLFGGATNHNVLLGSATILDDLDPFTMIAWIYLTTLTAGQPFLQKGRFGNNTVRAINVGSANTQEVELNIARQTTYTTYITNTNPLSTNKWIYVAGVFSSAAAAGELGNIYIGDLATIATEATYGTAQDGSGTVKADQAENMYVGNNPALGVSLAGRVAHVQYHNAALTAGQVKAQQFRPHKISSTVLFMHVGFGGTGTQADLSGNLNNGTVTGATVAAHVPLGFC